MNALTRKDIKDIYHLNKMSGVIETGEAFWVCNFLMVPYKHPLTDKCVLVRELTKEAEISCYPMEESLEDLHARISEIVNYLYYLSKSYLVKDKK